jgi:DNA-binding Lrp family transcriptional regulator
MDELDRAILNHLQGGFPVSERPFAAAAAELGTTENELISRLARMLEERRLTRFGPLYNAERMGGAFTLAALSVPAADFERIAALVNALPEVAHNYERAHRLNMWFVLATDTPEGMERALRRIESETGCRVYNFPKLREYFVELKLAV